MQQTPQTKSCKCCNSPKDAKQIYKPDAHCNIHVLCSGLCSSRAWWPMAPNFCSWDQKILLFSYKSYAGHPRFYRFRARLHKTSVTTTGTRTCTRNLSQLHEYHLSGPLREFTQVVALTIFVSVHLSVVYATEIAGVA